MASLRAEHPDGIRGQDLEHGLRGGCGVVGVGVEACIETRGDGRAWVGERRLGGGVIHGEEVEADEVADCSGDGVWSVHEAGITSDNDLR